MAAAIIETSEVMTQATVPTEATSQAEEIVEEKENIVAEKVTERKETAVEAEEINEQKETSAAEEITEQKETTQAEVVAQGAIVPFRKPQGRHTRKQIIASIRGRTIDEAIADTEAQKKQVAAELQEAVAGAEAQTTQANEARAEFDQAQAEVDGKIELEIAAVGEWRKANAEKDAAIARTNEARKEHFEAQKKLAILEHIAREREQMREFTAKAEEAKKVAVEAKKAAEEAKQAIAEEKKLVKQNLEAARRAWADMDTKGSKRAAAKMAEGEEADLEEPLSKRPMVHGMEIASPMVSQFVPKLSDLAMEVTTSTLEAAPEAFEATQAEDFD